MRLSLRACIFIVCLAFTLTATGIAGFALFRYGRTVQSVTALYDKAFEGVDYSHKAREGFMGLVEASMKPGFSFTSDETRDKIADIKQNLDTANELTFSDKDVTLIRQIESGLAELPKRQDMTSAAAAIDKNLNRLIGRYTAARIDSKDAALTALAQSDRNSDTFLIMLFFAGITAGLLLVKAVLPPIRRSIAIASSIAGGKLDNLIDVRGMSEIAQLLEALSIMQEALFENIRLIEAARKAAVQSEIAKGEFLANMSHELRTPLNNILGSVQLLHDRPMPEKDRELFTIVERSSKSLLGTVNDILDLSKLEAGEVHLENIDFDIYETLRNATQLFLPRASKKGIVLSCQSDMDNLHVLGDSMRVEGILNNLLGNAMRYTERGSINVRARAYKAGAGKVMVRIEVYDSGIGIPQDRQQKIFERFTQADTSTTRRYGGTGLGLTITKQLVELMKGRIGVESEVGKGSMFWFEITFGLPAAGAKQAVKAVEAIQAHENAIPVGEAMVLVAEDHELNRAFMKRLFENLGITHFVFAENGLLAVEEVKKRKFDLVLMDCQMPEMDGYEATAAIRALDDAPKKIIPIIAMTANAMASDRERCLKAGMDSYISKPFDIDMFKRTLSPWVNFSAGAKPQEKPPEEAAAAPADMEILVASSMGDEKYLKEMIALFVSTADEQLKKLKTFISEGKEDSRPWAEAAHGLKGAAAIVGAENLRQMAAAAQIMEDMSSEERLDILKFMEAERDKLKKFFLEKKLI